MGFRLVRSLRWKGRGEGRLEGDERNRGIANRLAAAAAAAASCLRAGPLPVAIRCALLQSTALAGPAGGCWARRSAEQKTGERLAASCPHHVILGWADRSRMCREQERGSSLARLHGPSCRLLFNSLVLAHRPAVHRGRLRVCTSAEARQFGRRPICPRRAECSLEPTVPPIRLAKH